MSKVFVDLHGNSPIGLPMDVPERPSLQILDETSRTLSEYLLIPNLTTEDCTPDKIDLSTALVRHRVGQPSAITIATPMVSAIMQAVSSPRLAIALAQTGGLSFLHHNQSIEEQAAMVQAVKRHKAGFRYSEANITPDATLGELTALLTRIGYEVAIVTDDGTGSGRFLGIISTHDFHPKRHDLNAPVHTRMRHGNDVVTARTSISLSDANTVIWDNRLDVLPILTEEGHLASIVLRRDYELHKTFLNESVDAEKRFRVGAGINSHDYPERIPALIEAGADILCIDSSDGYSVWQARTLTFARERYGDTIAVGAGNVVDGRGFRYLADAGAAFIKVGIGGGSICITRDQKGIGRGQASALIDVAAERDRYAEETGIYVPLCCDGGLINDSHMAIAYALGADFVMLGRYFARFEESPARLVKTGGQLFKEYWGEGSQRARSWTRYDQGVSNSLVFEEGVDGYVPFAGSLYDNVGLTLAKLRSTMSSCGARTLRELNETATLVPVSQQSFLQNTHEIQLREKPQDSGD